MLKYMLVLTQIGYPEHRKHIRELLGNHTCPWYATCKIAQLAFSKRNLIMAKELPSQPLLAYSFCVHRMTKHWREKAMEGELLIENHFFFKKKP